MRGKPRGNALLAQWCAEHDSFARPTAIPRKTEKSKAKSARKQGEREACLTRAPWSSTLTVWFGLGIAGCVPTQRSDDCFISRAFPLAVLLKSRRRLPGFVLH